MFIRFIIDIDVQLLISMRHKYTNTSFPTMLNCLWNVGLRITWHNRKPFFTSDLPPVNNRALMYKATSWKTLSFKHRSHISYTYMCVRVFHLQKLNAFQSMLCQNAHILVCSSIRLNPKRINHSAAFICYVSDCCIKAHFGIFCLWVWMLLLFKFIRFYWFFLSDYRMMRLQIYCHTMPPFVTIAIIRVRVVVNTDIKLETCHLCPWRSDFELLIELLKFILETIITQNYIYTFLSRLYNDHYERVAIVSTRIRNDTNYYFPFIWIMQWKITIIYQWLSGRLQ